MKIPQNDAEDAVDRWNGRASWLALALVGRFKRIADFDLVFETRTLSPYLSPPFLYYF